MFPTLWQGPLTRSTTKQSSHTAPWLTGHAGVCRFAPITHVDERGQSGARLQRRGGEHSSDSKQNSRPTTCNGLVAMVGCIDSLQSLSWRSADRVARVSNAAAVTTDKIQNKTVVPHHAALYWLCWCASIRFNHSRGQAWTEWHAFPMLWR